MTSSVGNWTDFYKLGVPSYGTELPYKKGAEWLSDCRTVEDWGCGGQAFRNASPDCKITGIDGSPGFCDIVADLAAYQSSEKPEGLFMRGVLEHNHNWRDILANALSGFTKRMSLVLFTDTKEKDILIYNHPIGVPVLHLCESDLEAMIRAAHCKFTKEKFTSPNTEFGAETIYRIAPWIDLAVVSGSKGREDCQAGWQEWVGGIFADMSILDVGSGLGLSRSRLGRNGNTVTLQDPGPGLNVDIRKPVALILSKSYDVVTAFDVIEHIEDDYEFLDQLKRIARKAVVVTTPNRHVSHNANPHHIREYTPGELMALAGKNASFFAGDSNGKTIGALHQNEFTEHNKPHHAFIV